MKLKRNRGDLVQRAKDRFMMSERAPRTLVGDAPKAAPKRNLFGPKPAPIAAPVDKSVPTTYVDSNMSRKVSPFGRGKASPKATRVAGSKVGFKNGGMCAPKKGKK